jgi:hypothetical protein
MKYRHRLIERDAVLPAVAFGFRAIPFEMHSLGDAHMSASNVEVCGAPSTLPVIAPPLAARPAPLPC